VLPAAPAEEAEKRQNENHDQDDPEKRHEAPFVDFQSWVITS
jgi:hypothetical protein